MEIFVIGVNFRTASIQGLECSYVSDGELETVLRNFSHSECMEEVVVLSTCNRTEVYGVTDQPGPSESMVISFLKRNSRIQDGTSHVPIYSLRGEEAVRHLFRVSSSLDSLVVGEPQILGQVKRSYETAFSQGCTGRVLNYVFPRAFKVAKKVRSDTNLSKHSVSVASVSVKLAQKVFSDLSGKSVLLIGAGVMAEQIGRHLIGANVKKLYIRGRNQSRATKLANELGASPIRDLAKALLESDIVISSTSSKSFVLKKDEIKRIMRHRKRKPIFMIDISIPRDIDPAVQEVGNVYLFNLDDLKTLAEENRKEREKETEQALEFIESEVSSFLAWCNRLKMDPVIERLKLKVETLCENEILKSLKRIKNVEYEAVQVLARSLTKKILHDPILVLKQSAEGEKERYSEAVQQLFRLQ